MKKLLLGMALLMLSALAMSEEQPKHLISVGTGGLGWSGESLSNSWDENKSGTKKDEHSEGKLTLNYHYILSSRIMLGAELTSNNEKDEMRTTSGHTLKTESSEFVIAASIGYNFNQDVYNSWWLKAALGAGRARTAEKDSSAGTDVDAEGGAGLFSVSFGKRFSFESWGLKNFTYSPSLALTSYSYGGDLKDAGLESASGATLNIIKFDVLF